ncbi:MAG: type II restriction endonuclease, partial [Bacteroidetes bacterium]|nr:type II restriction endonuclease [Bacteroidota bacterium]
TDKKNLVQFYQAEPKILIRRIISRQDRLSVTYCDEKLVFKKDINPFIPTDDNFDCYFLTGIISSKLISFIYLNSSSIATKDDFRQTTLTELRKLPIPKINTNNQKPISDIVREILRLKSENINSDTSNLENQIDQLVYQLYDLTEEEIEIIENSQK